MTNRVWLDQPGLASAAGPVPAPPAAHARPLQIGGITPFTSIDFPGRLAAVVFVQGCPWRCTWCHNPHLQPRRADDASGGRPWAEVRGWLARRTGLIDGVVFSGGEPTIDPGLAATMADVRAMGFAVGLHTAGIYPRRLQDVLPLADWVGFDVKAPLSRPALLDRTTGVAGSTGAVQQSLRLLRASGVAFECRTTAHPALLDEAALQLIGDELAALGITHVALQRARPVAAAAAPLDPVPKDWPSAATLEHFERLFPHFVLRDG
nr:anaerobic ribonucleoside-triphosphate reductase activating protein [Rubrivivax pictus]